MIVTPHLAQMKTSKSTRNHLSCACTLCEKKYVYKRQILKNLSAEYKQSIPWIRKQILDYEIPEKVHNPRAVVLVCDATFSHRECKHKMVNEVINLAL